MQRLILALDTGVDDVLALAYVLGASAGAGSAGAELLGVVASYGNVSARTALRNTRAALEVLGAPNVPVYLGAEAPSWADSFIPDAGCEQFHGDNGLAGLDAADYGAQISTWGIEAGAPASAGAGVVSVGGYRTDDPHARPAGALRVGPGVGVRAGERVGVGVRAGETTGLSAGAEFIAESVARFGDDLTVVTAGPLTDVAAAVTRYPELAGKLRLVMMGGALTVPGNCYDGVAETNIIQDPEAADAVFKSGARVTMVGLDVTHQCLLGAEQAEAWRGSDAGEFLADLAAFSIAANREADAMFAQGMPLHDPLAVAVALDPSLVRCLELPMQVELETGDFTGVRGRTIGQQGELGARQRPVRVAVSVDSRRFVDGFVEGLASGRLLRGTF